MDDRASKSDVQGTAQQTTLAERFGLHRPELRAWAMYDWANSAFMTTIIAAVFPIYYETVAATGLTPADATLNFSLATTVALVIVALAAPPLGAIADVAGVKKKLLFAFQCAGLLATASMYFIYEGDWQFALFLFVVANIGISGAFTFYDSLLPHIARPHEMDRVSSSGYALGYLGGGLLLALNLLWIYSPETFGIPDAGVASRLSFLSVAVWWGLFSIPLFRRVPEPQRLDLPPENGRRPLLLQAFLQLGETLGELRRYKQALMMLLAFLVYNDGINTIIRMASLYGSQLGIAATDLILALLMVQFVGVPFAFLFARVAHWIGAKRAVFIALAVYLLISLLAYFMTSALHFYLLAFLVGMVQGGSQALSRSLFARMIPRQKSSEFFSFFAVFEKFAGILGPAVFAAAVGSTGSSRVAILSVALFFVVGALLLSRVNVEEGERAARQAEEELSGAATGA